jgi:hypothetical protein
VWLGELATLQGAIARLRDEAFPAPPEPDADASEPTGAQDESVQQ